MDQAKTGRLLQPLTKAEADELWRQLVKALRQVAAEAGLLERCTPDVRDMLYGPGCLQSYYGLRDDLIDLLDNSL